MFEILKKKISSFTDKLKKTIEKKSEEPGADAREQQAVEIIPEKQEEKAPAKEIAAKETVSAKREEKEKKPGLSEEEKIWKEAEEEVLKEEAGAGPVKEIERHEIGKEKPAEEKPFDWEKKPFFAIPKIFEKKRELKAKIGIGGKIKRVLRADITIEEKDLGELLEELELSFLEADVEQGTADEIIREMRQRISGKKISASTGIDEAIKKEIREILLGMMKTGHVDVLQMAKQRKPLKILFLGPNGAGKTTSMAKLTRFFELNKLKSIWSASDTFRAASIEQLEKHAENLGVRVVKHAYGADPAAVAFDAVKAAEAKGIDVVLIDSAGRQETNKNLMEELKKIVRVAKPDLKIYVGESFTGQALLQQAEEYNKAVGIDGFILTKIDCDSK
ncbi:MAG: signal recognition particle receptor subunit alpha, partial [Candidatus ainarchaeum sp.]|nr:signal recognition particle receptor subunit alpha [Candidatus ainarchaeum sp.]